MRLDKWLWAARFFKTRALAAEAIEGGKVELNEEKPKRSRDVRPGDRIRIRQGPLEHLITVRTASNRRGPAREAAALYEEEESVQKRREEIRQRLRAEAAVFRFGEGRPSKKERRDITRLKGKDD